MAITKVINDAVDLNQTSDYSGLRLPVGTTADVTETFATDYLIVGGGGGTSNDSPGGGGAGGLRTSYNNSTTTTNSLSFPSGKTAVATYMLDNNANDISGNYNGTETNISYNTGQYGGGAVFNGSSSKIDLGNNSSNNASVISVSLWFRTSVKTGDHTLINNGGANSGEVGYNLRINSNGYLRFGTNTYSSSLDVTGSVDYANNIWHHVVLSYNAGTYNIYVDGNTTPEISGTNGTFTGTATRPTWIGQFSYTVSNLDFFNGTIDQVRIYDSALSSTDASNIYTNEVQAPSGGGTAAESSLTLTEGIAYDVTVGAGGASNTIGGSSIFSTITSTGGGRGSGGGTSYTAGSGGSGGGGSGGASGGSNPGGSGTANQGYAGGTSGASGGGTSYPGGGGGGAIEVGASPANYGSNGGNGGAGLAVNILNATNAATATVGEVSSSNVYYSGGGGGSTYQGAPGTGGLGGAGNGDRSDDGTSANPGTTNTGGGGGGTNATGGSGVVILRYPTASVSSFTTTGTLNTPSTTDTVANNSYPTTNLAYYKLDGNANGPLTTTDLGTLDYPSGTGCLALYELNGNANGYLTTTDLSTVNYPAGAGCIALYELNGNANDTSNTYNGGATDVTYNDGAFDQAAVFNGSSSKIVIPSLGNTYQNNFSVSFWFNIQTIPSGGISTFISGQGDYYFYCFLRDSDKKLETRVEVGATGYVVKSNTTFTNNSGWYHVCITKSSADGLKMYVNGTLENSDASATGNLNTSSSNNTLGVYGNTTQYWLDGKMDQVRIYDTALTSSQVTTLARGAGSAYNGTENSITYDAGAFEKAIQFSGAGSNVETTLANSNFTSDYSISFWVNLNNANTFQNFTGNYKSSGGYGGFTFMSRDVSGTYRYGFIWWTGSGSNYNYVDNLDVVATSGVWVHLLVTKASSTLPKLYVNGTANSLGYLNSDTDHGTTSENFTIGNTLNSNYSAGKIDQVRVFNTELSASDAATLARGAGASYNGGESNIIWDSGKFNKAALFNGSSSEITVNSFASLTQVGISMWVNIPDVTAAYGLINRYGTNREFGIYNYTGTNGFIASLYYNGNNGNAIEITASDYMTNNTWHHIAYTANGSTVPKLYIDGVEVGTPQYTDPAKCTYYTSSEPLKIGHGLGGYFSGQIDQVRIFSTALSSAQITDLYNEHYQTKFTEGSDTAIVFTEGTGTITFDGTNPPPPQGALRTNTSYSEDGSASVIEHYNSTAWKRFDATKYCTTNTLNFPPGAGCVASYNLNNNVNDIGNAYSGTNSNVTFNASGKFGAAGVFNGSNAFVDSGFTALSSTAASISLWVNIAAYTSYGGFTIDSLGTGAETRFVLGQGNSSGDLYVQIGNGSTSWWDDGTVDISTYGLGNWFHLVGTVDGTSVKIYINGSLIHTFTSSVSYIGGGQHSYYFGGWGSAFLLNGELDQIRFFTTALTLAQVQDLYNNEIACS